MDIEAAKSLTPKPTLQPVQSEYAIVYDDPYNDDPACVVMPSPNWMAKALHGGILPYSHVVLMDQLNDTQLSRTSPRMPPLTQEQAIEQLLIRDVPKHIWDGSYQGNKRTFVIAPLHLLPRDRHFRNAWTLNGDTPIHLPKGEVT